MDDCPDFLPPILRLEGTWEEILDLLYSTFTKDFKQQNCRHCGLKVIFNRRVLPDGGGKEEGFWHVVSKGPKPGERLIDYRRAERLPWARPLMESGTHLEIKVFDYDHGAKDKGIRRYVWLHNHDYVLVLQQKGNNFFWITAHHVDSNGRRRDLQKRYEERV